MMNGRNLSCSHVYLLQARWWASTFNWANKSNDSYVFMSDYSTSITIHRCVVFLRVSIIPLKCGNHTLVCPSVAMVFYKHPLVAVFPNLIGQSRLVGARGIFPSGDATWCGPLVSHFWLPSINNIRPRPVTVSIESEGTELTWLSGRFCSHA